jgi:glycosyltransferase involved in cell wall biosynthesis
VRGYCGEHGLQLSRTAITRFGADAAVGSKDGSCVNRLGLTQGKYILFVGTIEPRKGHRFLLGVWRRLLEAGVPQKEGFKLVFVGRPGWMVDDLLADIEKEQANSGTLIVEMNATDDDLAALYEQAAFCAYPSEYEGYGLPVVEAFLHGKSVIASNGGAIPEIAVEFSPCLDPRDERVWYETMRSWIVDPTVRQPFEAAIRDRFKRTTWDEAAAAFFLAAESSSQPSKDA